MDRATKDRARQSKQDRQAQSENAIMKRVAKKIRRQARREEEEQWERTKASAVMA